MGICDAPTRKKPLLCSTSDKKRRAPDALLLRTSKSKDLESFKEQAQGAPLLFQLSACLRSKHCIGPALENPDSRKDLHSQHAQYKPESPVNQPLQQTIGTPLFT